MGCETVSLADIAVLIPGFSFKSKEFGSGFARAIKIGNISRGINSCDLPIVDTSKYAVGKLGKYQCVRGDYLVAMTGNTIGKIGRMLTGTAYANQRVLKVSGTDKVEPGFLWAALCTTGFHSHVLSHVDSHSAQPNISAKSIGEFKVELPDLVTQKRISSVFMSIEEKIEVNNRLNGYLEELFDSCFKQSLNMVDETWDTASLLDIADYKNGLAMQKFRPNIGDKGLPVLKIRELGQESCGKDAERCRSDIDESVTVHDGDLIFSWSGTLLLRFWAGGDAGLNQHLFKVTSGVYPSWFYYAWTKHHLARFTMLAKDRATTMGHIKRSALEESEVLLPPKEKLAMQTKCMQPIIDQVIANKIEIRKLAALRDALLPKLMSGEIDVSKIDLTQLNSHLA